MSTAHTPLANMLLRMADDALILAHRHSEWTGLGPLLEADIAFSSIAQDTLGHALALYTILEQECGFAKPDTVAFTRTETAFTSCWFVELPNGEYDFSLMRQYLFSVAHYVRFASLRESSFEPLAQLARKVTGEVKYHLYHGTTWVQQLAISGNEESKARMQQALQTAWPFALGMFEPGTLDSQLVEQAVFVGEPVLQDEWTSIVQELCHNTGLTIPTESSPLYGGRKGYHSEHLAPLLLEMNEVFTIDPNAEW
jgi:ring-1,2-phenylacetyl-CoA epoxidase subunit PaaC